MSIKLNNIIAFAVGAVLGSAVTWKLVDKKYKQIAQEEIDSVKEMYKRKSHKKDNSPDDERFIDSESETGGSNNRPPLPQEYLDITSKYKSEEVDDMTDKPYVIPPEEYGELYGYECISLNYYTDGVVADDFDNVVEDVDAMIGEDSLDHFGEYEADAVFVRNDTTRCDYEILRDIRSFSEVVSGEY